jgi:hypothetical protein
MSRLTDLRDALLRLDFANDDHWTEDGLPKLEAIDIDPPPTRVEINKFSIFRRKPAAVPVQAVNGATKPATPEEIEAAQAAAQVAETNLAAARADVVRLTARLRTVRAVAASALTAWQRATGKLLTQGDLVRATLAAEQARKLALANGEIEPQRPARVADSDIDRMAQRYGDGNTFARKRNRTGASRGAYPASRRGELIPKLPSQR